MENLSNWLALFGALILWLAYIVFSAIARRYEVVFGKKTFWQLLGIAPFGLLLYAAFLVVKASGVLIPIQVELLESIAYDFLLLSGVLCLIGAMKFFSLIRKIT